MEKNGIEAMPVATSHGAMAMLGIGTFVNIIGILIGLFAVITVINTLRKVGGQVGSAFTLTLLGLVLQITALIFDALSQLGIFPNVNIATPLGLLVGHNIHEGLMVIGIIFFVMAGRQFAKLSQ